MFFELLRVLTQSILTVFLRDINLAGHVDCLNGLLGGHTHGHRDPGDGQNWGKNGQKICNFFLKI